MAVWQRGDHDRVVRTDREAEAIRRYVAETAEGDGGANPARWADRPADARGPRV